MPVYVPQVWADGDPTKPPSAARFNVLEAGVEKASIPTKHTALPGSPYDGQEIYFEADATLGVYWHLRYRSASASAHKWEFLGGPPLAAEVLTSETTTSTTYVDLATVGPSITVPLAGDYLFQVGATIQLATGGAAFAAVKLGAAATSDNDSAQLNLTGNFVSVAMPAFRRNGLAASAVCKVQYRSSAGNTGTFLRRNLVVVPARVS